MSLTAAVATHYHCDHTDALPLLRKRYGTTVWLHPEVAAPLRNVDRLDAPWLPAASIEPDRLLPAEGDLGVERVPLPRRALAQPDLVALPADDHRGRAAASPSPATTSIPPRATTAPAASAPTTAAGSGRATSPARNGCSTGRRKCSPPATASTSPTARASCARSWPGRSAPKPP